MKNTLIIFSLYPEEIKKFLETYYSKNFNNIDNKNYKIEFQNPIDMIDILSCHIDNPDKFKINMWVCLDDDIYINITKFNINDFIKYLYERYPY